MPGQRNLHASKKKYGQKGELSARRCVELENLENRVSLSHVHLGLGQARLTSGIGRNIMMTSKMKSEMAPLQMMGKAHWQC